MAERAILELEESWVFGMLWPKRLRIFEDRIETSNVELLRETVETKTYDEVGEVVVGGKGASVSVLIRTIRSKPILMRGVDEEAAHMAKALIESLTNRVERDNRKPGEGFQPTDTLVRKLAELRDAGVITEWEFETKRRALERREP